MIFFGERPLQHSIGEYLEYYHAERNHQGLGGQIIAPSKGVACRKGNYANENGLEACSITITAMQRDGSTIWTGRDDSCAFFFGRRQQRRQLIVYDEV